MGRVKYKNYATQQRGEQQKMANEMFAHGETYESYEEMLEVYVKEKETIDPNKFDKEDLSDWVGQRRVRELYKIIARYIIENGLNGENN